jgi:hypothetical protein
MRLRVARPCTFLVPAVLAMPLPVFAQVPSPAPSATSPAPPSPTTSPAPPEVPGGHVPPSVGANTPSSPTTATSAPWYHEFKYEAFVDTYVSINYKFPRPQSPTTPLGFTGGNQLRAFDITNHFALHWFGLDVTHAPDPVGGGLNLRIGPGAILFNAPGSPDSTPPVGLQYVKNAYVSWRPAGKNGRVTLTMGKFNQPFGSEVPESQYDLNYTRSLLYWYAQPLFLTGSRVDLAITDELGGSIFLVNGWNTSQDNNLGLTGAIQFNWTPTAELTGILGYAVGPEQTDVAPQCAAGTLYDPTTGGCITSAASANMPASGPLQAVEGADGRLRHFIDMVVDWKPTTRWRALFNADFGIESLPPGAATGSAKWYGLNLALRYMFDDAWAAALRGEYYADPQGFTTLTNQDTKVGDLTVTAAFTPTRHLIVKLDNRIDIANESVFQSGVTGRSKTQITTTLGIVGTTGM